MPKVSKKTAGQMGLVAAILFIIGNVVGVGIFFKNTTVFRLNNANAIGVLISWGISIIFVLCMALSFAEISSAKSKSPGVGGWAEQFCGRSFGRYAKTGYALIFWPANTFAVMLFAGEALLKCFAPISNIENWFNFGYDYGRATTLLVFIIGLVLFALFIVLNYFAMKQMGRFGSIVSFVKFAPIIMVVLLGILFGAMYNGGGAWATIHGDPSHIIGNTKVDGQWVTNGQLNPFGMFAAIPAILFSFEGYISVGSISNEIKNPEKNLSLSVILGVVVISVLYLALTIGCITAGTGSVYELMRKLYDDSISINAFQALTTLISVFIFICLIGCINGMAKGGMVAFQSLCEEGALFHSKKWIDKKPGNKLYAGMRTFVTMILLFWIVLVVPSSIMNTDAMADGSSTSMVVMLYVIYGVTVAGGFINRFTKKNEVRKIKVFPVTAVVGMLGSLFVVLFVSIYQMTLSPIMAGLNNFNGDMTGLNVKAGWGMFSDLYHGGKSLTNVEVLGWFWGMTGVIGLLPLINDFLIKVTGNKENQQLIWQKKKPQIKIQANIKK